MLKKLKKYQDDETQAVVEEEWCDGGARDVNMLRIEPDSSPAMTTGEWWADSNVMNGGRMIPRMIRGRLMRLII